MSPLADAVDEYLAMRRALGYQLTDHGRVLPQFARFLTQRGELLITTELALEFATLPAGASVMWWHQRLAMVRGFARYLQAFDARHEVPPANLLPATNRRARPYLFSEAEIEALLKAARSMSPPLHAASCEALIGLLAVSGMRVSEACGLDRSDVELHEGRLTVRHAKNDRSREIPLHASTVDALDRYVRTRDELCPHPKDAAAFFLSGGGGRPRRQLVERWFDRLRRAIGLDQQTLGRRARLHDLRHAYVLNIIWGRLPGVRDVSERGFRAAVWRVIWGLQSLSLMSRWRASGSSEPGKRSPPPPTDPPTRGRGCRCRSPGSAPDGIRARQTRQAGRR